MSSAWFQSLVVLIKCLTCSISGDSVSFVYCVATDTVGLTKSCKAVFICRSCLPGQRTFMDEFIAYASCGYYSVGAFIFW